MRQLVILFALWFYAVPVMAQNATNIKVFADKLAQSRLKQHKKETEIRLL